MGYRSDGRLADMFDVGSVDRCADRITGRVGDFLHDRVTHHTPVSQVPGGVDDPDEWVDARGGRERGTLKRSWKVGEVEVTFDATGERRVIDVYTTDPVAPHVEWDTVPHLIVPKDPDGWLRFWNEEGIVFAKIVHHPGTRGQHMMATALAETAAAWRGIAAEEVALWAGTHFKGGPPPYASRAAKVSLSVTAD